MREILAVHDDRPAGKVLDRCRRARVLDARIAAAREKRARAEP